MTWWPHCRAALIASFLLWQGVQALPVPQRITEAHLDLPQGRAEFDSWYAVLEGVGLQLERDEARALVVDLTARLSKVHKAILSPLAPVTRITQTGQSWAFFAAPDRFPNRLEVHIQVQGEWRPTYIAGHGGFDEYGAVYRFRRIRGLHDLTRSSTPSYRRLTLWIAEKTFEKYPEADTVKVLQVREYTLLPGESPRKRVKERPKLLRVYRRDEVVQ